jgi:hypothetical protein
MYVSGKQSGSILRFAWRDFRYRGNRRPLSRRSRPGALDYDSTSPSLYDGCRWRSHNPDRQMQLYKQPRTANEEWSSILALDMGSKETRTDTRWHKWVSWVLGVGAVKAMVRYKMSPLWEDSLAQLSTANTAITKNLRTFVLPISWIV